AVARPAYYGRYDAWASDECVQPCVSRGNTPGRARPRKVDSGVGRFHCPRRLWDVSCLRRRVLPAGDAEDGDVSAAGRLGGIDLRTAPERHPPKQQGKTGARLLGSSTEPMAS